MDVADMGDVTVLKARVRAVPDKGKANAALSKLVAGWLGVPASRVTLVSGHRARRKTLAIEGECAAATLADKLTARD